MQRSGLEYLWLLDHPFRGYWPEVVEQFASFTKGSFLECAIIRSYRQSIELHGGTPAIFSSAFFEDEDTIAACIRRRSCRHHPGFLFIGSEMRHTTPGHVDAEIAGLDPKEFEVLGIPVFFRRLMDHPRETG